MTKKNWFAAAAGMAASLMLLTACSGGGDTGGGNADATVRVAIDADQGCLDPGAIDMRVSLHWARQTADSLLYMDPDGAAQPWLATEYEVNEDATEYTFTLRDDVVFQDGSKLDAETVKANFDRLVELGADAFAAQTHLAGYESTEVVDEHTAVVKFSEPNVAFTYGVSTPQLAIFSKESVALTPEQRCAVDGLQGSGPFAVTDFVPMETITLERNDDYEWGAEGWENRGPASIKNLEFHITQSGSTRTGAALSGELDVVHTINETDAGQLIAAGFQNSPKPLPAVSASWKINQKSPILADEKVRQALLIGFDREEMVATKPNLFSPATGVLNSSHPFHLDQADRLAYDPDAAGELLDEAGWTMGSDGVREKEGQPLAIEVIVYTEGADTNMENVQAQLKKLGVELKISKVDANGQRERWQGLDYDMLIDWNTGPDAGVLESFFMFSNAPAEVEEMNAKQFAIADREERIAYVQDLQKLILDHAYMVPLWEENTTPFWSERMDRMSFDVAGVALYSDVTVKE